MTRSGHDDRMTRVAIAQLKAHLSEHLRRAEEGECIEVLDRKRPIARIVPIETEADGLELLRPTRTLASVRKRVRAARTRMTSLEALRVDRGRR